MYRTEIIQYIKNNFVWTIVYKNIESLCCTPETDTIL